MRIGLNVIYVDDQDQAEPFYTEVLGLQVKTSARYGPSERWLNVVSPGSRTAWSQCGARRRDRAGVPRGDPPGREARAVAADR
jgi:catechol 2,3-dioxygenase-like lactoylglutathione lyase family enzyme